MDKNYYFVLEPDGDDEGPYVLSEIRRRIEVGLLSNHVTLCRVGETDYLPVTNERYAQYFEPPRRLAQGTQPLGIQMDKPAVLDGINPTIVDAKAAALTAVVAQINPAFVDAKAAAATDVVHQAKPADTPPTLEAVTAAINAATTIVEPMRAFAAAPSIAPPRNAATTIVEPMRAFAKAPSIEPARAATTTIVEPVRAMGSARVIDVAPIAAPKTAAIDVAAIDASQSDMTRLDLVQIDVSANDMHAIDAVTVETAPVPRVELDLIDAPTRLDPVSGTVLDAATGFEDLAPTGPFEGVPSMVIDDVPREVLAPIGNTLPPGFAPIVETMPTGFAPSGETTPPGFAPIVETMPTGFAPSGETTPSGFAPIVETMPPGFVPSAVRRLEAPRASEVRALEILEPRTPLPLLPPPSASMPGTFGAWRVPSKKMRIAIAAGVVVVALAAVVVALAQQ